MTQKRFQRWAAVFFIAGVSLGGISWAVSLDRAKVKKHDFTGKCQMCHTQIPPEGASFEAAAGTLSNTPEILCSRCHQMEERLSHPVGVLPQRPVALQRFLDAQGRLSCITCHDVHKEDGGEYGSGQMAGLLRGHTAGRSFCFTCHNDEVLGANWRHKLSVSYAHASGRLEESGAGFLDPYSVECLSCHDGVISKTESFEISAGDFQHGIGLSHPVGVEYPLMSPKNDFIAPDALGGEVRLFDGKVGCLSCHTPYGKEKGFLVRDNRGSALCLSCHRK